MEEESKVSTTQRSPEGIIIPRKRTDPEAKVYLRGVGYFAEYEIEEAKQQRAEQLTGHMKAMGDSWERSQYGRACLELYKKFLEYKKLGETEPLAQICLDQGPAGGAMRLRLHRRKPLRVTKDERPYALLQA